jgi:tyrosyl-DNA phosphodiesterase 1
VLQRALEASKADGSTSIGRGDSSKSAQPRAQDTESATSAFLSERALMEKERLERQKRLRPDTSFEEKEKEESSKRLHLSEARTNGKAKASTSASGSFGSSSSSDIPTIDQVFWEGEVRQVANRHAEPRKDGRPTFRLTEILGKVCLLDNI